MNSLLSNPFEKYKESTLITIGSIVTILFSGIAFFLYIRLDGLLDMHFADELKIHHPLLDNIVNILTCSLVLFILGKYINPKTRFIDIFAASIVARIPYYPLILLNINDVLRDATKSVVENSTPDLIHQIPTSSLTFILVFALLSIGALIWYMILLYKGFKTATNAKGSKPIVLFIISILLIEVVSKIIINQY